MQSHTIKVADLLHNIGVTDTITLEDVNITNIWLDAEHLIQWGLRLESMSAERVWATFYDIECGIVEHCDYCGKSYTRSVRIDEYECVFTNHKQGSDSHDEIFPIDDGDNIDVSEPLRQAILLQEPITKYCYDCLNDEERAKNTVDITDVVEDDHSETWWTVIFR